MAFTIPNHADANSPFQAEPDSVDFDVLAAGYSGSGVISGCAVTAQGSPNMTVAVASGVVSVAGVRASVSGANATIGTADGTNPRFDTITINNSGTIATTAGTAGAVPELPSIPSNSVVLALIFVPANDTTIATAQITDKRVFISNGGSGVLDNIIWNLGSDGDAALVLSSGAVSADVEVTNVIEGTSDHLGTAANSLIVSNVTNDGDIMFVVSDGGNSKGLLKLDGANGRVVIHGGDLLMSGAQKIYFYDVGGEYMSSDGSTLTITGATALTPTVGSTSWANANHAHAASNSGGTVTASSATVATTVTVTDNESTNENNVLTFVAGADADGGNVGLESDGDLHYNPSTGRLTATQLAGTLQTAAQANVTSLGTLTALTVDDVAVNGKVITMTGSTDDTAVVTVGTNGTLSLVTTDTAAAAANIQITADGTVDIDSAGVLTLDSGAAINIEPAGGSAILLDGTISIDAGVVTGVTTIAASGVITAGGFTIGSAAILEAELEILDGATVTTAELNIIDGDTSATGTTIADADRVVLNDNGTMVQVAVTDLKTYVGGGPSQANQTAVEAETNQDTYVPPDMIKHSPGVAKSWVSIASSGAAESPSYNIASITDTGTGDRTVVLDTDHSTDVYTITSNGPADGTIEATADTRAVGQYRVRVYLNDTSLTDQPSQHATFGDQ